MLLVLLFALLGSTHGVEQRAQVDVVEINEYFFQIEDGTWGMVEQIILRRWYGSGPSRGHRVAQWWLVQRPISITSENGKTVVRNVVHNRPIEFEAKRIHRTRTFYDPERQDTRVLADEDRVPYIPCIE